MITKHIVEILQQHKEKGLNRVFTPLEKVPSKPSVIEFQGREVVNFCSNDYLRLSLHPNVIEAMLLAVRKYGVGSGGTRNISGTTYAHNELENAIAN